MWFLYAFLNPLSEGIRSVFVKKTSLKVDPILISWAYNIIPCLLFTPMLFFIDLQLNSTAITAALISSSINTVTTILYIRAISEGDISQVLPMMSLTPIILLFTSPILVGEFPPFIGLVGVVTIVVGSYLLNINFRDRDLLGPFKALIKNKGTRYMLIVAALWGISANFDKIGINNSSIPQHIIFMNVFIFTALTIYLLIKKKIKWHVVKPVKKDLLIISGFTASTYLFHFLALSLTYLAYVVAMKRMSGPMAVVLGHFFLKEPNIRTRLLGSIVMVTGVILIVLA